MERMIEHQIIALDVEALTNRMRRLELQGKVITLLNQQFDKFCLKSSARRTVEVNCEENCMEMTVGELRAPTFYFINETKFLQQVRQPLKSQIEHEQWLKKIIIRNFSMNGSKSLLHQGT